MENINNVKFQSLYSANIKIKELTILTHNLKNTISQLKTTNANLRVQYQNGGEKTKSHFEIMCELSEELAEETIELKKLHNKHEIMFNNRMDRFESMFNKFVEFISVVDLESDESSDESDTSIDETKTYLDVAKSHSSS